MRKTLILDEFHSFVATPPIVAELRKMDFVPDAQYKVEGERVFVFAKLVSLLEALVLPSDPVERQNTVRRAALDAMPEAYVSAIEAVTSWEIVPKCYEIRLVDGVYIIWQNAFNSFIPITLSSQENAHLVLADLLMGKSIPTPYDALNKTGDVHTVMQPAPSEDGLSHSVVTSYLYSFAGQVFQQDKGYNTEFDFSFRETQGFFPFNSKPVDVPASSLHSEDSYQDGFPLIKRVHYQNLIRYSAAWFFNSEKAETTVNAFFSNEESWFALFFIFDISNWHTPEGWNLNDEDQQTVNVIRHNFPELAPLEDSALYDAYHDYMNDVRYMRSFDRSDVYRDEEFLFYILGLHSMNGVPEELQISDKANIGMIAAYFYTLGLTAYEAVEKAKTYASITRKIHRVMWDCKKAFSYISLLNDYGGKITTSAHPISLEETFRMFRKHNAVSISATQSFPDYGISDDKLNESKTTKH